MSKVHIVVDGVDHEVEAGQSLRRSLLALGTYIPGVCDHPDLDAFKPFTLSEQIWQGDKVIATENGDGLEARHCNLCLVSINGETPVRSCDTVVADGLTVDTSSLEVITARRNSLKKILARHPHACLTCPQRHGCDRIQCSMNVPVSERCCELLGRCEIGKVSEYIGIPNDTPAYHNEGRPSIKDEPLFLRDYEICISCTRCVRVCRDVRGVDILGAALSGNALVVGTTGGPSLEESLCRFCGACVEVCPTGALRDQPGTRALVNSLAPCTARCPLEIDVPGYMESISEGNNLEALEIIREKAVLPGVLGYACFHPCESNCRRDSLDGSASICALKRFVADVAGDEPPEIRKNAPTGRKIAVIGGGPAGLAAAADLLRLGHEVTVFDREEDLGGMLKQTLPDFRLPDGVIDRDLNYLYQLGLQTRLGVSFGDQISYEELQAQGYNATVVAIGLGDPVNLGVPGEDLPKVMSGMYLLREAAKCAARPLNGRVVVIGGGAVAIDTAMTARRSGAYDVMMLCLESEKEMPAHPDEIRFARDEGIVIMNGWGVERFEALESETVRITAKKCLAVFDEKGKFNPKYDPDTTKQIECEWVAAAIGQRRGAKIEEFASHKDVFLAGDFSRGASSIVEAMADGRKIAVQVDKYLGGNGSLPLRERKAVKSYIGKDSEFHLRKRVILVEHDPAERIQSMSPFIPTLTPEEALAEARRCLRCHLRAKLTPPDLPPDPWHKFSSELLSLIPDIEGVIILADDQKKTVKIAGSSSMRQVLGDIIDEGFEATYCHWEADPMYTKRESELIQAHLQAFGEMPGAGDLDDLF